MTTLPFSRKALSVAILTTLLAACGGGSSDSSTAAPTTSTITGTASKGTLKNAIVIAYKIKDDGTKGEKITETKTDANGQYTLPITNYTGAVLLELSSDANTKMACDIAKGCGTGNAFGSDVAVNLALRSVLASAQGNPKSSITPFTHMATEFALSKSGGLKKANIESALSQVQQLFDLPDLQNTALPDATKPLPADLDVQRYALLNAAIGQLASNINDIRPQIDAIVAELKTHNGQLKSSETTGTDTTKDLADVLKAAQAIADSNKLSGLNSLIKAAVAQHLQEAQATTNTTNVQPTDNAGATDLTKAKSFMSSIKQLVTKAQDLQSLESSLVDKTKTVDTLVNGNVLLGDAVTAVIEIMSETYNSSWGVNTRTWAANDIQALLNEYVNDNAIQVTALTGTTAVVNATAHTVTLNGSLSVKKSGVTQSFAVSNFQVTYPDGNTAAKTFEVKISPSGTITSNDLKLSMAANADSKFNVTFPTTATLLSHQEAEDEGTSTANDIPVAAIIKLDKVTITALKAPSNEFKVFEGSLNFAGAQVELDTALNQKRQFPILNTLGLIGKFSSDAGDVMEAGLTIDTTGSNPKISPEEGATRTNLFNYKYNSQTDTATFTANNGTFGYYWNPTNTLTITEQGGCLVSNTQAYLGCYNVNNVADGLVAAKANDYLRWALSAYVRDEGDYIPQFSSGFNFKTNASVNGTLDYSDDTYSEDATHFAKATISLNAKAKLGTQEVSANITAKRTGYGTNGNDGSGEFMADIMIGNDKLTLKAPVIGGVATYTLTNKDNVSVEVNALENQDKVEIKVGGKTAGWIYKMNGLPVAKFTDNSLMAL